MFVAPTVAIQTSAQTYAGGMRGVAQTVRVMRAFVQQGRTDPDILSAARSIVFLTSEKCGTDEVCKLLEFVQAHIRYVSDIVDVETIATAAKTLATRSGDCDDQSVLFASLCEAIGHPTRFVVAAYEDPRVMEHVYVQVYADGQWLDADPTERGPLGWAPDALATYVETV